MTHRHAFEAVDRAHDHIYFDSIPRRIVTPEYMDEIMTVAYGKIELGESFN